MIDWGLPLLAALAGALACRLVVGRVLRSPSPRLVRTNVDGKQVPAVLGWGILAGAIGGAVVVAVGVYLEYRPHLCLKGTAELEAACLDLLMPIPWKLAWLPLIPVVVMFAAGLWDDLKGDERPRGFRGHLHAARGRTLTGGTVKLIAGGVVGLITAVALADGFSPWFPIFLLALCIALSANLVNLLDRAPGRALKFFLVLALPLFFLTDWRIYGAPVLGAALVSLPVDLKARAMLGDAGANPLGAILGLGLAIAVVTAVDPSPGSEIALGMLVTLLLGLNLASERWSFSAIIERSPWLARLDDLGRE